MSKYEFSFVDQRANTIHYVVDRRGCRNIEINQLKLNVASCTDYFEGEKQEKKNLYRYETQEPRTFFIPFLLRTNFHMGLDGGIFVKLPTHIRTYVHHRSESIHFVFCLF